MGLYDVTTLVCVYITMCCSVWFRVEIISGGCGSAALMVKSIALTSDHHQPR